MRIVHFLVGRCNPESANGVDKTIYYLSKTQAELGHKVNVVAITSKPMLSIPGVQLHHYLPGRTPFSLPKSLIKFINDYQPEIVHMHSVYTPLNWSLSKLLLKNNIPYTITPHGGLHPQVSQRNHIRKLLYKNLFELTFLNHAAFIHAVGDKNDILQYGVKTPIITVPNGFDIASIPKQIDPQYLKNTIPLSKDKRVFVFIGRLDLFHKGLDLLVHAFSQIDYSKAYLVIVGPDWNNSKKSLSNLIHTLKLENAVYLLGPAFSKKKFNIIASSDVFLNTSRWEGLPFTVLEACAMAKPSIVSLAANIGGFLEKYNAGYIVKPEINSIVKALDKFISIHTKQLSEIGRNARKMVETEFCWTNLTVRLIQEYEKFSNT